MVLPLDLHGRNTPAAANLPSMWAERVRKGLRLLVAEVGAVAVWAFLLNRVVIHWVDGPLKTTTVVLLGLGLATLGGISALSMLGASRKLVWVWVAILASFGVGELRRTWLRREYGAVSFDASPWHPVTTTDLELRRFSLAIPGGGSRRVRVVALSDLHVSESTDPAYVERVHAAVRALDPDVIVMTGDYVSRADRIPAFARWLRELPRPRHGAYAVLGNHDYWTKPDAIKSVLTEAGFELLAGKCTSVAIPEAPSFRLCGTEAPWGPAFPADAKPNDATATLVLSHTPDNVYALAERGATAVFAGHTHGGQWRIPGLGPLIMPSRYGRRFDQGHFLVEGTHLFVSAGVGADAPNLRLWCPPDVLVVDLVRRVR